MIYGIRIRELGEKEFLVTCRDLPECTFTACDVPTALAEAAKAIPGTIELFYRQKKRVHHGSPGNAALTFRKK